MWECVDSFCTGQKRIYELRELVLQFGSVCGEETTASSQGFQWEVGDIVRVFHDPRHKTAQNLQFVFFNTKFDLQSFSKEK